MLRGRRVLRRLLLRVADDAAPLVALWL
jgi:hypothetical protein